MPDSGGGSAGLQYQNTAGGITGRQGLDAGIEAHEDAVPLRGLPKEDGIGPLPMAPHSAGNRHQASRDVAIQRPEFVALMTREFGDCREGGAGADDALRHGRVGQQTQHSELCQWIRRPSLATGPHKPCVRRLVTLMPRPDQGQEHIDMKIRELIHEGNVRRIIIKDEQSHTFMEIPVTVAAIGVILAPVLAAVGAIATARTGE